MGGADPGSRGVLQEELAKELEGPRSELSPPRHASVSPEKVGGRQRQTDRQTEPALSQEPGSLV